MLQIQVFKIIIVFFCYFFVISVNPSYAIKWKLDQFVYSSTEIKTINVNTANEAKVLVDKDFGFEVARCQKSFDKAGYFNTNNKINQLSCSTSENYDASAWVTYKGEENKKYFLEVCIANAKAFDKNSAIKCDIVEVGKEAKIKDYTIISDIQKFSYQNTGKNYDLSFIPRAEELKEKINMLGYIFIDFLYKKKTCGEEIAEYRKIKNCNDTNCPCSATCKANDFIVDTSTNTWKDYSAELKKCYLCNQPLRRALKICMNALQYGASRISNEITEKGKEDILKVYGTGVYACAYFNDGRRIGCAKMNITGGPRHFSRIARNDNGPDTPENNDLMINPTKNLFTNFPVLRNFRDKDENNKKLCYLKDESNDLLKEWGSNKRGTFLFPKGRVKYGTNEIEIIFNPNMKYSNNNYSSLKYNKDDDSLYKYYPILPLKSSLNEFDHLSTTIFSEHIYKIAHTFRAIDPDGRCIDRYIGKVAYVVLVLEYNEKKIEEELVAYAIEPKDLNDTAKPSLTILGDIKVMYMNNFISNNSNFSFIEDINYPNVYDKELFISYTDEQNKFKNKSVIKLTRIGSVKRPPLQYAYTENKKLISTIRIDNVNNSSLLNNSNTGYTNVYSLTFDIAKMIEIDQKNEIKIGEINNNFSIQKLKKMPTLKDNTLVISTWDKDGIDGGVLNPDGTVTGFSTSINENKCTILYGHKFCVDMNSCQFLNNIDHSFLDSAYETTTSACITKYGSNKQQLFSCLLSLTLLEECNAMINCETKYSTVASCKLGSEKLPAIKMLYTDDIDLKEYKKNKDFREKPLVCITDGISIPDLKVNTKQNNTSERYLFGNYGKEELDFVYTLKREGTKFSDYPTRPITNKGLDSYKGSAFFLDDIDSIIPYYPSLPESNLMKIMRLNIIDDSGYKTTETLAKTYITGIYGNALRDYNNKITVRKKIPEEYGISDWCAEVPNMANSTWTLESSRRSNPDYDIYIPFSCHYFDIESYGAGGGGTVSQKGAIDCTSRGGGWLMWKLSFASMYSSAGGCGSDAKIVFDVKQDDIFANTNGFLSVLVGPRTAPCFIYSSQWGGEREILYCQLITRWDDEDKKILFGGCHEYYPLIERNMIDDNINTNLDEFSKDKDKLAKYSMPWIGDSGIFYSSKPNLYYRNEKIDEDSGIYNVPITKAMQSILVTPKGHSNIDGILRDTKNGLDVDARNKYSTRIDYDVYWGWDSWLPDIKRKCYKKNEINTYSYPIISSLVDKINEVFAGDRGYLTGTAGTHDCYKVRYADSGSKNANITNNIIQSNVDIDVLPQKYNDFKKNVLWQNVDQTIINSLKTEYDNNCLSCTICQDYCSSTKDAFVVEQIANAKIDGWNNLLNVFYGYICENNIKIDSKNWRPIENFISHCNQIAILESDNTKLCSLVSNGIITFREFSLNILVECLSMDYNTFSTKKLNNQLDASFINTYEKYCTNSTVEKINNYTYVVHPSVQFFEDYNSFKTKYEDIQKCIISDNTTYSIRSDLGMTFKNYTIDPLDKPYGKYNIPADTVSIGGAIWNGETNESSLDAKDTFSSGGGKGKVILKKSKITMNGSYPSLDSNGKKIKDDNGLQDPECKPKCPPMHVKFNVGENNNSINLGGKSFNNITIICEYTGNESKNMEFDVGETVSPKKCTLVSDKLDENGVIITNDDSQCLISKCVNGLFLPATNISNYYGYFGLCKHTKTGNYDDFYYMNINNGNVYSGMSIKNKTGFYGSNKLTGELNQLTICADLNNNILYDNDNELKKPKYQFTCQTNGFWSNVDTMNKVKKHLEKKPENISILIKSLTDQLTEITQTKQTIAHDVKIIKWVKYFLDKSKKKSIFDVMQELINDDVLEDIQTEPYMCRGERFSSYEAAVEKEKEIKAEESVIKSKYDKISKEKKKLEDFYNNDTRELREIYKYNTKSLININIPIVYSEGIEESENTTEITKILNSNFRTVFKNGNQISRMYKNGDNKLYAGKYYSEINNINEESYFTDFTIAHDKVDSNGNIIHLVHKNIDWNYACPPLSQYDYDFEYSGNAKWHYASLDNFVSLKNNNMIQTSHYVSEQEYDFGVFSYGCQGKKEGQNCIPHKDGPPIRVCKSNGFWGPVSRPYGMSCPDETDDYGIVWDMAHDIDVSKLQIQRDSITNLITWRTPQTKSYSGNVSSVDVIGRCSNGNTETRKCNMITGEWLDTNFTSLPCQKNVILQCIAPLSPTIISPDISVSNGIKEFKDSFSLWNIQSCLDCSGINNNFNKIFATLQKDAQGKTFKIINPDAIYIKDSSDTVTCIDNRFCYQQKNLLFPTTLLNDINRKQIKSLFVFTIVATYSILDSYNQYIKPMKEMYMIKSWLDIISVPKTEYTQKWNLPDYVTSKTEYYKSYTVKPISNFIGEYGNQNTNIIIAIPFESINGAISDKAKLLEKIAKISPLVAKNLANSSYCDSSCPNILNNLTNSQETFIINTSDSNFFNDNIVLINQFKSGTGLSSSTRVTKVDNSRTSSPRNCNTKHLGFFKHGELKHIFYADYASEENGYIVSGYCFDGVIAVHNVIKSSLSLQLAKVSAIKEDQIIKDDYSTKIVNAIGSNAKNFTVLDQIGQEDSIKTAFRKKKFYLDAYIFSHLSKYWGSQIIIDNEYSDRFEKEYPNLSVAVLNNVTKKYGSNITKENGKSDFYLQMQRRIQFIVNKGAIKSFNDFALLDENDPYCASGNCQNVDSIYQNAGNNRFQDSVSCL